MEIATKFERQMETKGLRRLRAEHRFLCRQEKLEAKAEQMVGELCREGREVFYFIGRSYREFATRTEAIEFIVRNGYVR